MTQTGLIANVFAAPIFRQEPRSNDFLMICCRRMGLVGGRGKLGVVLREMPSSMFCVGQVEPRVKGKSYERHLHYLIVYYHLISSNAYKISIR